MPLPRARNGSSPMYSPSTEQILEWWDISQLCLPPYRFKHNGRYHPYVRYVDPIDSSMLLGPVDDRDALRRSFTIPQLLPPPIYQEKEANNISYDIRKPNEEEERLRYLQVTRNLSMAADKLATGPSK